MLDDRDEFKKDDVLTPWAERVLTYSRRDRAEYLAGIMSLNPNMATLLCTKIAEIEGTDAR